MEWPHTFFTEKLGSNFHARYEIIRRFKKGLKNLFNVYLPIVDKWFIADNSGEALQVLSQGSKKHIEVSDQKKWLILKDKYYGH